MKPVDLKHAREFCKKQIDEWRDGWTERIGPDKGKITNPHALDAIAVLKFILKTLPKPPAGRRPKFERDNCLMH
jgi:hypothetical protein